MNHHHTDEPPPQPPLDTEPKAPPLQPSLDTDPKTTEAPKATEQRDPRSIDTIIDKELSDLLSENADPPTAVHNNYLIRVVVKQLDATKQVIMNQAATINDLTNNLHSSRATTKALVHFNPRDVKS